MTRGRGVADKEALTDYIPHALPGSLPNIQEINEDTLLLEGFSFIDKHPLSTAYHPRSYIDLDKIVLSACGVYPSGDRLVRALAGVYSQVRNVVFKNCLFDGVMLDTSQYRNNEDEFSGNYLDWWDTLKFENCSFASFRFDMDGQCRSIDVVSCEIGILGLTISGDEFGEKEALPYVVRRMLRFKETDIERIDFSDTHFMCEASFIDCRLGAPDVGGDGHALSFWRAKFSQKIVFRGVTFVCAPAFFSAELSSDVSFSGSSFLDVRSESAVNAYRVLKHQMMKVEADYEVQRFHALELEARYNVDLPKGVKVFRDKRGPETIASFFMSAVNGYGQDLWKPLFWLVFLAVVLGATYKHIGSVGCVEGKQVALWVRAACEKAPNLIYSIRNAFGPFGLLLSDEAMQPNTLTVKILGAIHLLISSIIWFIWILQIRSRFKL